MLLGIVAVAAILIGGTAIASKYKSKSMHDFCEAVTTEDSPEGIIKLAEEKGFPVFDSIERRGVISVLNQRSFVFRYACEIEFKDRRVVGKRVVTAD